MNNGNRNLPIRSCEAAFTLAEVLITLGIIGVVAAVALPALITNINDRANSERQANIALKITQAMEQMRAHGELVQYSTTDDFVDVLQKYLKITKRCSKNNIAQCWPVSTVSTTDSNGNAVSYNVSGAKIRTDLLRNSANAGDNVGLILADGASIIMTYDPSVPPVDIGDKVVSSPMILPISSKESKTFAYTTTATGAIDFIMDVNGKKGPNKERFDKKMYDVRSFRLASFGDITSCEEGTAGCVKNIDSNYSPLDCSSSNSASYDYQKYCTTASGYSDDYWAGAKKACAEAGLKLPDSSALTAIKTNKSSYTSIKDFTYRAWASTEDSQTQANYVQFNNSSNGAEAKNAHNPVICVK